MEYLIKRHLPNYVDATPLMGSFTTRDELIAISFVHNFLNVDELIFEYFARSRYVENTDILIAQYETQHWVVGYIQPPLEPDFPLQQWIHRD